MTIRLIVANTDKDWFDALSSRPDQAEVNFWAPGEHEFRALKPGELLIFKLKAPWNAIVGGGVFAHSSIMPVNLAWEAFGQANGVASLADMRQRLARLKRSANAMGDFRIGCRIVTQPIFLPQSQWLPQPTNWKRNTVSFETYNTDSDEIFGIWEAIAARMQGFTASGFAEMQSRFGAASLITPRLGQGAFRIGVMDAYSRRCTFTGERTLPALEAAHIRPYAEGGVHALSNGLLLRRDLHSLFDQGYITLTPASRIEVSRRIKEEFENGKIYYALHGQEALAPHNPLARPHDAALRWHNETRFLG